MSTALLVSNLFAYALQITVVIAVAFAINVGFRVRVPRARLLLWQAALAACVLLPVVEPWKHSTLIISMAMTDLSARAGHWQAVGPRWRVSEMLVAVLLAGLFVRAAWLALGLVRLRRYRRAARPLGRAGAEVLDLIRDIAPRARLLLSAEIASPVTFGVIRPVVLLPSHFRELSPAVQEAIVCHELIHVARRDWIYTIGEELIRAALWFHPAIWWLLGQVHLSREQTVDSEVVARTQARQEYVDALLAIAGVRPQLDLAPAPLFLRRRHLKQRVVAILKERSMSKARFVTALAVGLGVIVIACWVAAGAFPLEASPQVVADAEGVSVDAAALGIVHRAAVDYPEPARRKGVQGNVIVEVSVDAEGNVNDARVVSGPEELRRATLQSVLQWHFAQTGAPGVKQVGIAFALPAGNTGAKPGSRLAVLPAGVESAVLKRLTIAGLSKSAEEDLRARLPVTEGATVTDDSLVRLQKVAREFDEHLEFGLNSDANGSVNVVLTARTTAAGVDTLPPPSPGVKRLRVGGNVQQAKLVSKAVPVYPPAAKQARVQGLVRLQALIDRDGNVASLQVLSGDPLLVPAATDAVKRWTYNTTLLNGDPVEVITAIDVNFTLMP
jgi:TonB family protein